MIINLTQHLASTEQAEAGVRDLPEPVRSQLQRLLTFEELPDQGDLLARAGQVGNLLEGFLIEIGEDFSGPQEGWPRALIGGAPFFMGSLQRELEERGVACLFAFSRRESVEQVQPDGSVRKTAIFRHVGFVEAD